MFQNVRTDNVVEFPINRWQAAFQVGLNQRHRRRKLFIGTASLFNAGHFESSFGKHLSQIAVSASYIEDALSTSLLREAANKQRMTAEWGGFELVIQSSIVLYLIDRQKHRNRWRLTIGQPVGATNPGCSR